MVEVRSIACASCGAPISVPESVKFVTCAHCGSSLKITTSEGAVYSELREALDTVTAAATKSAIASERVANELELKRLQEELPAAARTLREVVAEYQELQRESEAKIRSLKAGAAAALAKRRRDYLLNTVLFWVAAALSPLCVCLAALTTWAAVFAIASPQPHNGFTVLDGLLCFAFPASFATSAIAAFFVLRAMHRQAKATRPPAAFNLDAQIASLNDRCQQFFNGVVLPAQGYERDLRARIEVLRRALHPSGRWSSGA